MQHHVVEFSSAAGAERLVRTERRMKAAKWTCNESRTWDCSLVHLSARKWTEANSRDKTGGSSTLISVWFFSGQIGLSLGQVCLCPWETLPKSRFKLHRASEERSEDVSSQMLLVWPDRAFCTRGFHKAFKGIALQKMLYIIHKKKKTW